MNPILLKPSGDGRSQVVVNGRVVTTMTAREYYSHVPPLRETVIAAYTELARRFDVVVIEGAGSVSELNLRAHDVVNLWLVTAIRAPWLLVADIERGGVFASIIGTVNVLTPEERALLRGFAINKFRGDRTLFDDGERLLEERTTSKSFGVFPFVDGLHLDAEDSLAIAGRATTSPPPGARTAIVRLPHLSNATDFRLLTWADWVDSPPPATYDVVILPGSKNTLSDLEWLRGTGLAEWVSGQHRRGATIIGICGGYQMLGRRIDDPHAMEHGGAADGLGLLPVTTTLTPTKETRVVSASTASGVRFGAYEIHLGRTTPLVTTTFPPFATLDDGSTDGVRLPGVVGTYLHGALEHPAVCAELFGIPAPVARSRSAEYARLADWFERHGRDVHQLFEGPEHGLGNARH